MKIPIKADEVYEVFVKKGGFPTWAIILIAGVVVLGVIAIIVINNSGISGSDSSEFPLL